MGRLDGLRVRDVDVAGVIGHVGEPGDEGVAVVGERRFEVLPRGVQRAGGVGSDERLALSVGGKSGVDQVWVAAL